MTNEELYALGVKMDDAWDRYAKSGGPTLKIAYLNAAKAYETAAVESEAAALALEGKGAA